MNGKDGCKPEGKYGSHHRSEESSDYIKTPESGELRRQQGEGKLLRSSSLQEALEYRADYQGARVIAGGTDVLVNLRRDKGWKGLHSLPLKGVVLLDISGLAELDYIRLQEVKAVEIGALTRINGLTTDDIIKTHLPLLAAAARTIGSTQIRNRATLGGNICNASPAGDLIPPLLAYDAGVILSSFEGERVIPLRELITGPYRTALGAEELLTAVRIPLPADNYRGSFQKVGRRQALNIARLNLALLVKLDSRGILGDCRVVPGAATPYPCRFSTVEQSLNGRKITELNLEEIGEAAAGEMVSITGERWSTRYKKPALAALLRRGLQEIREGWLEGGAEDAADKR